MTEEAILRRIERLEEWREKDLAAAKHDRHETRDRFSGMYSEIALRVMILEKAQSGVSANAQVAWMKWVMATGGAVIAFLAAILVGTKK